MKTVYFATNNNSAEWKALCIQRPQAILVSFARWGNMDLQEKLIERIGYRPGQIIADSGAFTFAYSKKYSKTPEQIGIECFLGRSVGGLQPGELERFRQLMTQPQSQDKKDDPIFLKYIRWVHRNRENIDFCIAMDVIGDPFLSLMSYFLMKRLELPVIPVYHMGTPGCYMEAYLRSCAPIIALGGSAIRQDNGRAADRKPRAAWASEVVRSFPWVKFHMLGTLDFRLIDQIPGLASADGTSWAVGAKYNGLPKVEQLVRAIQETEKKVLQKVA